jgi:predicted cupin superfamily sugar epimerase
VTSSAWIRRLQLRPHPEGGHYREVYRSRDVIPPGALPRFTGARAAATSIYYLLESGACSALHRIRSDEIWHHIDGAPLLLHRFTPDGRHTGVRLGRSAPEDVLHHVVPGGDWFGAEVVEPGGWALLGCTVAPGFDFEDFELGRREALLAQFPEHRDLVLRLTRA